MQRESFRSIFSSLTLSFWILNSTIDQENLSLMEGLWSPSMSLSQRVIFTVICFIVSVTSQRFIGHMRYAVPTRYLLNVRVSF